MTYNIHAKIKVKGQAVQECMETNGLRGRRIEANVTNVLANALAAVNAALIRLLNL